MKDCREISGYENTDSQLAKYTINVLKKRIMDQEKKIEYLRSLILEQQENYVSKIENILKTNECRLRK